MHNFLLMYRQKSLFLYLIFTTGFVSLQGQDFRYIFVKVKLSIVIMNFSDYKDEAWLTVIIPFVFNYSFVNDCLLIGGLLLILDIIHKVCFPNSAHQ